MILPQKARPLRLFYAAGPGNVLETYHYWRQDQADPSQIAVTYSGQFYDLCHKLGAKGYVISSFSDQATWQDEQFIIKHRPNPLRSAAGLVYHFGYLLYGLRIVLSALLWRADVAVVANGTTYWFVLAILTVFGVRVIPSIHCVLWCKFLPRKRIEHLITVFDRPALAASAAILAVSKDIVEQVQQVMGHHPHALALEFLPFYYREEFRDIPLPDPKQSPFKVLYIGRIEENKGVFDLLEIAQRFHDAGRDDIHFGFCGTGSALEPLKQAAQQANLKTVEFYGYCYKPQVKERLGQAHVLIVPSKTTFIEGFGKVVAEGILAGRPVITSQVCPALSYVRPAVVEVLPDDVQGYGDAILKLRDDLTFYCSKQQGCLEVQEQFYDFSRSWGAVLEQALRLTQPGNLANSRSPETVLR